MPLRAIVETTVRTGTCILILLIADDNAAASDRWTAVLGMGGEALVEHPAEMVDSYALAMSDYRTLRSEMDGAFHMAGRVAALDPKKWHWRSDGGGSVKRIGDGLFRLTEDNCLSALCSEVDCFAGIWPEFDCTDGQPRKMAAPDLGTVVFDGIVYTRSLPAVDETALDEMSFDLGADDIGLAE